MVITNTRNNTVIASNATKADTFVTRLVGLLNKSFLEDNEALIIPGCKSVHMFFMRFPIDVIFCTKDDRVVRVQKNLKPWRISKYEPAASYVIEVAAGTLSDDKIKQGDQLLVK